MSVSFLNHKRQRVQRYLTRPVMGTHSKWVRLEIGPITPHPEVRFVAIGCHLVQGNKIDIEGTAWFDDLWLGKLPQLLLVSNYQEHFVERHADVEVTSQVSGLDTARPYRLHLQMQNGSGDVLETKTFELQGDDTLHAGEPQGTDFKPRTVIWKLPPREHGYYRVESLLERDGFIILEKQTTFAVMDLAENIRDGEFGWVIEHSHGSMQIKELLSVALQSGINWMKYPLWQSVNEQDAELTADISELFERLNRRKVRPIGLLNKPPARIRDKFAKKWTGFSEIFVMPPDFWSPTLEPVIARFSSHVHYWQLGDDNDVSFVGMTRLGDTLATVKKEFDRIGQDTHIGVHWHWNSPIPTGDGMRRTFLSVSNRSPLSDVELVSQLQQSSQSKLPRWVVLKPLARSKHSLDERSTNLVKRMVAAKIAGAEGIFAWDVFDPEYGMLNRNGSPTPLFLPWRTTALALQGAEYLGSFNMRGGSQNHAFARDGKVALIVWNDEPVTEEMYLGTNVVVSDIWGRQQAVRFDKSSQRHLIEVGPIPKILYECSESIARWRMAVQFENGRVRSEYGGHPETILGENTFSQGVDGVVTLILPKEWQSDPKTWKLQLATGEKFKLPLILTLPPNASLGSETLSLEFEIAADRPYKFRIDQLYQIGMDDILVEVIDRRLEDGRLEIEQLITNNTEPVEIFNFRCSLFVPGQKWKRQFVTKLGRDVDRKFYHIPNADSLRGKQLWLRAEQVGGRRRLNKRWIVGENWDKKPK